MNEIRAAKTFDAERIARLILKTSIDCCFSKESPCPDWYRESVATDKIKKMIGLKEYEWLVASQGNEIIGVLAVEKKSCIKYYFVLPEFQGLGIGRSLWSEAIRRSLLSAEVTVRSSIIAVPVYEKLGFVKTGDIADVNGMLYQPMAAKDG